MTDFNNPTVLQSVHKPVATTPSYPQHIKPLAVIAMTMMMAACGGGNERGESNEGNENRTTATFTTVTTSTATPNAATIANGKALYAQNCFACHGANIAAAKNSNNTLNAIASNKGGMGFLTTKITSSQADDIAAYLSFGL
jgi:mono/diheme cytochrome c family protein